ncbi:unnamed protein product [Adineta ricciae]|uniref:Uncharacterized protein n=1 Tax=Adineta ricciae TaxID=249248 RepID=A0A814EJX6_ADIRI|nr:unnamed protein product [Adineta ricciae]
MLKFISVSACCNSNLFLYCESNIFMYIAEFLLIGKNLSGVNKELRDRYNKHIHLCVSNDGQQFTFIHDIL